MFKTILVPAAGDETDLVSFATALSIARDFSAHIDVLHVRLDLVDAAIATTPSAAGGSLVPHLIEQLERDATEREAKARRMFEDFCAREELILVDTPSTETTGAASAQWHVETGDEASTVASYGMLADLIVAGRGAKKSVTARSILETALLETGRPLLIPSAGTPPSFHGGTIAIAWKPTPQAARAVTVAMPLLNRAREILVMTVTEDERPTGGDRLVRNLAWHGFTANVRTVSPNVQKPAQALLASARDNAQLLVMGGYGHSRIREWLLGGFTQHVLVEAPLPVLIVH